MSEKFKKIILIDLDGVLNTYTGNFDVNYIPPIKEGAVDFLKRLNDEYEIRIFTTRNRLLASKWVIENNIENYISDITNVKDVSYLIVSWFLFHTFKSFAAFCCKNFKQYYYYLFLVAQNCAHYFGATSGSLAFARLHPTQKPLDDRCICFNGDFKKLYDDINNFNVWYKK